MFGSKQFVRFFGSTISVWNSSKNHLAQLRKKTGYTFANCKKALDMHNNDIEKAEKWLHEQAQALGWSKATNVGGRKASEGVVAVVINKNHGALVEINCETDFVARNNTFQTLANMIAKSCISVVPQAPTSSSSIKKEILDGKSLAGLAAPDGKTLADHVALHIGLLGENMILKRGVLVSANENVILSGNSHPAPQDPNNPLIGKYGAILAFQSKASQSSSGEIQKIGKQLCQHVIGMNPKAVGDPEQDKPQENADDESNMIYQEYILDPEIKVQEVLNENNITVVDFVRFEVGESNTSNEEASTVRAQA
ncbi:Elongation factor Ts, mitochondrial [Frankliniella fusca]|uniref:Elongation factor Ts, mitochondrial n=1 Tax=Frankliniella fusca TaxID=407009 RepID=A0AAE1HJQ8_9NEOP|nr:Elongation factor Ts, mitochondrial [Frankliniella fusca]